MQRVNIYADNNTELSNEAYFIDGVVLGLIPLQMRRPIKCYER